MHSIRSGRASLGCLSAHRKPAPRPRCRRPSGVCAGASWYSSVSKVRCRPIAVIRAASVLVDVLTGDELEHGLVAKAALGAFFAQLVDQVLLEHDRGGKGLPDRPKPTGGTDVIAEIPALELLDLEVALTGLPLDRFRLSPSRRHRSSFRPGAWADS